MKIYKEWRPIVEISKMTFTRDILPKLHRVFWSQSKTQEKMLFQISSLTIAHFSLIKINQVSLNHCHQELLRKMIQIMKVTKEMSLTWDNNFQLKKLKITTSQNQSRMTRHASLELKPNVSTSENLRDKNNLKMNKCKENWTSNSKQPSKLCCWRRMETKVLPLEFQVTKLSKNRQKRESRWKRQMKK